MSRARFRQHFKIDPADFQDNPDRGKCPPLPGNTYEERYGITKDEVTAYERKHGISDVAFMYRSQRWNAYQREIEWNLTLREWIDVWGDKITRRGQGKDKLAMCRKSDRGPYSVDNVYIGTPHENSTDKHQRQRISSWARHKYWTLDKYS